MKFQIDSMTGRTQLRLVMQGALLFGMEAVHAAMPSGPIVVPSSDLCCRKMHRINNLSTL